MDKLLEIIKKWIFDKKVGKITINFFRGGISSIKLEETIKIIEK